MAKRAVAATILGLIVMAVGTAWADTTLTFHSCGQAPCPADPLKTFAYTSVNSPSYTTAGTTPNADSPAYEPGNMAIGQLGGGTTFLRWRVFAGFPTSDIGTYLAGHPGEAIKLAYLTMTGVYSGECDSMGSVVVNYYDWSGFTQPLTGSDKTTVYQGCQAAPNTFSTTFAPVCTNSTPVGQLFASTAVDPSYIKTGGTTTFCFESNREKLNVQPSTPEEVIVTSGDPSTNNDVQLVVILGVPSTPTATVAPSNTPVPTNTPIATATVGGPTNTPTDTPTSTPTATATLTFTPITNPGTACCQAVIGGVNACHAPDTNGNLDCRPGETVVADALCGPNGICIAIGTPPPATNTPVPGAATPTPYACAGDCLPPFHVVTQQEVNLCVAAFGGPPPINCAQCDVNQDGVVRNDDIAALSSALNNGCPGFQFTPTPTPPPAGPCVDATGLDICHIGFQASDRNPDNAPNFLVLPDNDSSRAPGNFLAVPGAAASRCYLMDLDAGPVSDWGLRCPAGDLHLPVLTCPPGSKCSVCFNGTSMYTVVGACPTS